MLKELFAVAEIPQAAHLLIHARLRGICAKNGGDYTFATTELLECLQCCRPQLLLIPAYTIYSFLLGRVYHHDLTHSEVGRFSEELRCRGYSRTDDPMYSLLDIGDDLPSGLDYTTTFGRGSVCGYLHRSDTVIVNVDMPGFYATPVHQIELEHQVPYRVAESIAGFCLYGDGRCEQVNYHAYLRRVATSGAAYPPYNQQRRRSFLLQQGVIHSVEQHGIRLEWARLNELAVAIDSALSDDKLFLVD